MLREDLLDFKINRTEYPPALHQLIADNQYNPALQKLDLFVRARTLETKWKLDPKRMQEINNKYGPVDLDNEEIHFSLDWRSPFSHAIYWAVRGLDVSGHKRDFTGIRLRRIVYHSLQKLFMYGNTQILANVKLTNPERGQGQQILDTQFVGAPLLFNSQDLRMFPVAYQATLDILQEYIDAGDKEPGGVPVGSANLARLGIVSLYLSGHRNTAIKYLNHLKNKYPDNNDYKVSLDQFVQAEMREQIIDITPNYGSLYIDSLLWNSYREMAIGNEENAYIQEKWAEQIYMLLQKEYPDAEDKTKRLSLEPLSKMRWEALLNFLKNDALVPDYHKLLLMEKIKIKDPVLYERVMEELQKLSKMGHVSQ
ncbi:MAG: hypothetical protein JW860_15535, partial [Sedimentisphaerales bacterium]|nr:hypothetical protein [Sedimentisphaerales bacterium]